MSHTRALRRTSRPFGAFLLFAITAFSVLASGCAAFGGGNSGRAQEGIASWYGERFQGRPTASGEPYDMRAMTAAHPTLSFGTRIRVTHLENGRSVTVRINDRGPFIEGRIVDLSRRAAEELGIIREGVAPVRVEVLSDGG